jgi:acetolactate synthase-1/3 small subunit
MTVILSPKTQTLSVLVEDKPGVLARVSALISRRGYNIVSLTVAPSVELGLSRINMVVEGDESVVEQIVKQLFKLIHVVKISELAPDASVHRELLIASVTTGVDGRATVSELLDIFGAAIVDVGADQLSIMLAAEPSKLDDLLALLAPYGLSDVQRTGAIAIPKLSKQSTKLKSVQTGKAS